jgi:hypothetical protein
METLSPFEFIPSEKTGRTLKSLVNGLVKDLAPATVRNGSFVINDVPEGLCLAADADIVAAVLGNLFTTVTSHSTGSCIRISAKAYSDVVMVQLRDQGINGNTLAYNLQATQPIAEKIGGFLGVTSQWKNETVIVFSFPNLPVAA